MIGRLCQTSFTVANLERSVAFYTDMIGLRLNRTMDIEGPVIADVTGNPGVKMRIALLDAGGYEVELIEYLTPLGDSRARPRHHVGSGHLAFEVEDADAVYERLSALGVTFASPPQDFGAVKACYFEDPDGITLELIERKAQASTA